MEEERDKVLELVCEFGVKIKMNGLFLIDFSEDRVSFNFSNSEEFELKFEKLWEENEMLRGIIEIMI